MGVFEKTLFEWNIILKVFIKEKIGNFGDFYLYTVGLSNFDSQPFRTGLTLAE